MNRKRNWKKVVLLSVALFLAVNFLIIMPGLTVIVYESVFGTRLQTLPWMERSVEEFSGLQVESYTFPSKEGQLLAGYGYSKSSSGHKALVILCHGYGSGGQNTMLPLADFLTSEGYFVFAYDATGNGASEGKDANGLPQGVADLDFALRFVKSSDFCKGLPIFLLGHSWGAYSAGSVLAYHPDISGVVMISGPNNSLDLMVWEGQKTAGVFAIPERPYLAFYEWMKFGPYAKSSAMKGFASSDASVMIVQGLQDDAVPPSIGYDIFYEAYSDSERFTFVLYPDRGHNDIYFSEESKVYRDQLNRAYLSYLESYNEPPNEKLKESFMDQYPLDKKQCFEPDENLMDQILEFYDACLK